MKMFIGTLEEDKLLINLIVYLYSVFFPWGKTTFAFTEKLLFLQGKTKFCGVCGD